MNGDTQNFGPRLAAPGTPRAFIPESESQQSEPQIALDFGGHALRILMKDGEPWFFAREVCEVLELSNSRMVLKSLDEDEKGVSSTYTLGGRQETAIINESGLYTLILRCRDAVRPGTTAHRFRKWVTREVLPAIHKQGRYDTKPSHSEPPKDPIWLYDGVVDDLAFKLPSLFSIQGGYLFLLGLSNGSVMLCASSKPTTYIQTVTHKLAEFNVTVDRIVATQPHGYYQPLRNRILKRLADLPRVGQTFKSFDIETMMARMEPVLRETSQTQAFKRTRAGAVKAELQAMIGEASRLVEALAQAER